MSAQLCTGCKLKSTDPEHVKDCHMIQKLCSGASASPSHADHACCQCHFHDADPLKRRWYRSSDDFRFTYLAFSSLLPIIVPLQARRLLSRS